MEENKFGFHFGKENTVFFSEPKNQNIASKKNQRTDSQKSIEKNQWATANPKMEPEIHFYGSEVPKTPNPTPNRMQSAIESHWGRKCFDTSYQYTLTLT